MSSITVPPGCMGVELPNGKKLDATRSGTVKFDSPADERAAMKSGLVTAGVLSRQTIGFGHVKEADAHCTECRFHGWSWQTVCPKCGGDMTTETE
jgi:hypothetical protein